MDQTSAIKKQGTHAYPLLSLIDKEMPFKRLIDKLVTFEEGTTEQEKEKLTLGILKAFLVALVGLILLIGILLYVFT